jgi:hypothetical protein
MTEPLATSPAITGEREMRQLLAGATRALIATTDSA